MMDGSTYEGEWANNLRQGMGTHWMKNGDVYKGEWNQGMKHGKGQLRRKKEGIIITGTFEQGKASGLCVVAKTVNGQQVQELIVFKKGIQVAKNKKGVECGDIFLAFVSCILFVVYFGAIPFALANFGFKEAFLTGKSDQVVVIAIIAVIVWCVWMCCASCASDSAKYIQNMEDFVDCLENIDRAIKAPPEIYWHIECWHYETRTRQVSDGQGGTRTETYQEKVVTHVANTKWRIKEW